MCGFKLLVCIHQAMLKQLHILSTSPFWIIATPLDGRLVHANLPPLYLIRWVCLKVSIFLGREGHCENKYLSWGYITILWSDADVSIMKVNENKSNPQVLIHIFYGWYGLNSLHVSHRKQMLNVISYQLSHKKKTQSIIAPTGFWQDPRMQPRRPRVYTYKDKEYLLKK